MKDQKRFGVPEFVSHTGNQMRRAVLETNKQFRNAAEQAPHMDFGSIVLTLPELDFYVLARRYPDLVSPDPEISTKAWDKFLRSSESQPYKVRATDGKNSKRLA
jgi:hypothetical protein